MRVGDAGELAVMRERLQDTFKGSNRAENGAIARKQTRVFNRYHQNTNASSRDTED